jgi:SAM-dependent methyltransferase
MSVSAIPTVKRPERGPSSRPALVAVLDWAAACLYGRACGVPPYPPPWQWQWVTARCLHWDLRTTLAITEGRALDGGCRIKPHLPRFLRVPPSVTVGIDLEPAPMGDVVIQRTHPWPFPDDSFDLVPSTLVQEHTSDVAFVQREIQRVLTPRGYLGITVPFCIANTVRLGIFGAQPAIS